MDKIKLTAGQKKDLIKTVKLTIEEKLFGKSSMEKPPLADPVFSLKYGLFVTLKIEGCLRGCIGYIEGIKPLKDAVPELANAAAFRDPRFSPLTKEEFSNIEIEMSILYPLENVTDINDIKVGRDGLVIEKGYSRGLLLPQVPLEYGWGCEEFLGQTCVKAGLEKHAWKNGADIYKFEAEVFDDKEEK